MKESAERIIESAVPQGTAAMRLDVYLPERFSYLSRTAWQKEIAAGRVLVNAEPARVPGKKVRPGDIVSYIPEEMAEPEIDPSYTIIFEDEYFVAVNKSGNLPVHPSGVFFRNTLVMLMEQERGVKFFPVHRLDRETSGTILLGKTAEAASMAQKIFGTFTKKYIAVVRGVPVQQEFEVNLPTGPARGSIVRKKRGAYEGAPEESLTRFRLLSAAKGYSLVEAVPVTGRMHQIRVHLESAGYPIVGDKLYGHDGSLYLEYVESGLTESVIRRAGFTRCALHSCSLEFIHPYTGASVEIIAPIPADMQSLMARLGLALA